MLPKFHGLDSEDAYVFITKFQNVCNLMNLPTATSEAIKLHLLPHTLQDLAEKWMYSSATHSIKSWDEFVKAFLKKFYPHHKTARIRNEISQFTQSANEPFWKCWDRLKDLLVQCPHHGYEKWRLCMIVYEGLNLVTKQMLETICQCNFLTKEEEEAWQFLEDLAEQTQQWESSKPTATSSRGGMHQVDASILMKAEVAALQKKIEAMESKFSSPSPLPPSHTVKTICATCHDPTHLSEECPHMFDQVNAFQARARNDPYSPTYNPGWRNHPNFSWNQNQSNQPNQFQPQQGQTPPPNYQPYPNHVPPNHAQPIYDHGLGPNVTVERVASLEKGMEVLMKQSSAMMNQIAHLNQALSAREKGNLPSQNVQNPGHPPNPNGAPQGH